jgi:hypothetical protein
VTDDIFERVRETVGGFASGAMGELNTAFARLARVTYLRAFNLGSDQGAIGRMSEVLKRAADEIESLHS